MICDRYTDPYRSELDQMTHFADLTPYRYAEGAWDIDAGEPLDGHALNVGWLSAGEPFATGDPPAGLVENLLRRATREVHVMRGWHRCEFCPDPVPGAPMTLDGKPVQLGHGEIRVTGAAGAVYAAPTLIAHYVAEHRYLPPAEFIQAALHGPDSG